MFSVKEIFEPTESLNSTDGLRDSSMRRECANLQEGGTVIECEWQLQDYV